MKSKTLICKAVLFCPSRVTCGHAKPHKTTGREMACVSVTCLIMALHNTSIPDDMKYCHVIDVTEETEEGE